MLIRGRTARHLLGLAAILCGFPGATTFDEMNLWRVYYAWLLPRGPFRQPTYYGGVPIKWDGSPGRKVTIEDKANQARDLLNVYELYLSLE